MLKYDLEPVAILRDAVLRTAPQDVGRIISTATPHAEERAWARVSKHMDAWAGFSAACQRAV